MKFLLLCIISSNLFSQFQSPTNPYYWKNKIGPKSEYWQQDVDYTIDAYLDEKQEIIKGKETIVYSNNSPHELKHLFFNLYQNAFIKNSYLSDLQEANNEHIQYGKWEKDGKGNEILSIKVNGVELKKEIDGSIMKVWLKEPMKTNTNISIEIQFNTYYSKGGATRRRMKSFVHQKERHFNGAHWYPRLAVYDRKFGWCTDQHLNREFYGDFGTYRVSLNMPSHFVVDATGVLQNRQEVMPDSLRKKLDLSNFWKNKWDTTVTFKIKRKDSTERKIWKFLGENIHDFAWIAGPHYRIDEKINKGISTVAMVLEPHASGWKNACDFTHKVIECYSRDFGQYAYPKMIVADAQDGMEYPMLTMDGGSDPGYRGLLAHEVGHNWFYGMVNNNETYRAMLDEGFTQFLTAWSLEAIDGKNIYQDPPKHPYLKKYFEPTKARDARVYNSYMTSAMNRESNEINRHSDGFDGATNHGGGYGMVYNKTATMLYNLQYTLGDSLFLSAMKYYFNQWSFRHPYVEDFRNSIIEYTKVDLNWFFDEWIETSKVIDYSVLPFRKDSGENQYLLRLKRKGEMQMPLDITVYSQSGKRYKYYIPNTWFEKKTDATILPRWIGWDSKLNTEYEAKIYLPEKPINAIIDPSGRLADINERNNSIIKPVTISFDSKTDRPLDRKNYSILWRPDVWYNNFDGVKIGIHTEGKYFRNTDVFHFDFWVNTGLGKWAVRPLEEFNINTKTSVNDIFSVRFLYETPMNKLIKNSRIRIQARHLDGVALGLAKYSKSLSPYSDISIAAKSMWRYRVDQGYYDYNTAIQWNNQEMLNNSVFAELSFDRPIARKIHQQTRFKLRSSILSMTNYSYIEAEHKERIEWNKLNIKWRAYGRIGTNTGNLPTEVLLNAGGASGEEMLENEFTRSVTIFPSSFTPNGFIPNTSSNMHFGGGLNLRGYSFVANIVDDLGNKFTTYNMNSGMSLNSQVNFEKLSPFKFHKLAHTLDLGMYIFGDIGTIVDFNFAKNGFSRLPMISDAGLGASLSLKKFGFLTGIKPLTFRFDMPFYLSHPATNENKENFKFRWLVGVEQAF